MLDSVTGIPEGPVYPLEEGLVGGAPEDMEVGTASVLELVVVIELPGNEGYALEDPADLDGDTVRELSIEPVLELGNTPELPGGMEYPLDDGPIGPEGVPE